MSIFDAYDQEFSNLSREIQSNTSELKTYSTSNPDKSGSLIRQIEGLLSQANDLIKQMNVEVRSHDAATRKVLTEKVGQYSKSLLSMKSDFERAKEVSQRSNLIGAKSGADRQRLLDVNDKLARQNEMIMNATRTVAETEEVGLEITNELARNREKIDSSHAKVREFSGVTDSARRLLTSMQRRDVQQKMILCFIALVLIVAIAVTVYYTVGQKKK